MEVVIRAVRPEDLEAVTRIEASCFPQAEAASEESLSQRIAAFSGSFFVAEAGGKVVGFINGSVTDDRMIRDEMFEDTGLHNPGGRYQAIFGLDVCPEFWHRGIAGKLMERMIAETKEKKRNGVILTCKKNLIQFYEQFGYRSLGISGSRHGGAVWYDMILEF